MTIILKLSKYDNLQYDNYFEKIVIFEFLNMTKKKTYGLSSFSTTAFIGNLSKKALPTCMKLPYNATG